VIVLPGQATGQALAQVAGAHTGSSRGAAILAGGLRRGGGRGRLAFAANGQASCLPAIALVPASQGPAAPEVGKIAAPVPEASPHCSNPPQAGKVAVPRGLWTL